MSALGYVRGGRYRTHLRRERMQRKIKGVKKTQTKAGKQANKRKS